jgi:uncharacterized protein
VRVFADTFFYLALLNQRDESHQAVLEWSRGYEGGIVTTQWVLAEVANAFSGSRIRSALKASFEALTRDEGTLVIEVSARDFGRGLALYDRRPDKYWSLTDCISFVVMADEGPTRSLTGDHHFEQAGFVAVFAGD